MGVETVLLAVTAASAIVGGASAQDQARRADNARDAEKKKVKAREAELASEAAAKEAAKKKAETAGQRAGFGPSGAAPAGPTRSAFISRGTGFNNVAEDNISRSTLFGN